MALPQRPTTVKPASWPGASRCCAWTARTPARFPPPIRKPCFPSLRSSFRRTMVILSDYSKGHRLSVVHVPLAWTARRQSASGEGLDRSQAEQCRLVRRFVPAHAEYEGNGRVRGDARAEPRRNPRRRARHSGEKVGCPHLLTTLGSDGMALFSGPSEVWHVPTMAQDVFDVTGAGDTVIATLGLRACRRTAPSGFLCAGELCRRARRRTGRGRCRSPDALREAIRELPVTITKW